MMSYVGGEKKLISETARLSIENHTDSKYHLYIITTTHFSIFRNEIEKDLKLNDARNTESRTIDLNRMMSF